MTGLTQLLRRDRPEQSKLDERQAAMHLGYSKHTPRHVMATPVKPPQPFENTDDHD